MAPLKVAVFDYASAGGPLSRKPPGALRRQHGMLLAALRDDLAALPGVELCTMSVADVGGTGPSQEAFSARFASCVEAADAVWPLATESAGLLEGVSRDILRGKRILLGSAPGAVRVSASKLKVARALAQGGVPAVATYSPHGFLPDGDGAWVVKPDDGAGCLDTRLFSDRAAALAWIRAQALQGYVLQPFVPGKVGSLSLLCCDGAARVLACNQERMAVRDNRFHFLGSTVNGWVDADGALERLAQGVAAALPTLWGYVGVDFIHSGRGPVVLDVNPRLTAAYAGIKASIGCNPAGLVIDLLKGPSAMSVPFDRRHAVSVDVGSSDGGNGDPA
jgi:predicted ATP-grasp superfamily ATP-dependent carboligase